MRILYITGTRLGDAVISCGLLEWLVRRHAGARVTVACGGVAAELFARLPGREATLVIEKKRFDSHWLGLWARCVGTRWDLVVDLRGSAVSFALLARRRAVMRGGRRPGARVGQIGALLGVEPAPLPVVWTDGCDRFEAARLMGDGPVLALGPTANWAGKIWPAERFVAVARALVPALPFSRVAVFGGPGAPERAAAAPVLAGLEGAVDLVGQAALPVVAACLARAALFIGNDSGLMHLAAAAGAPTIGLFGPSRASEYGPAGRRAIAVQAPGPEGEGAMAAITVEAVLAAARQVMA